MYLRVYQFSAIRLIKNIIGRKIIEDKESKKKKKG